MKIVDWLIERLGERSTLMGILGIGAAAGLQMGSDLADAIIAVVLAVVGLINVVRKER